jgi:protein involved in polysaccharide export with SLBB domain
MDCVMTFSGRLKREAYNLFLMSLLLITSSAPSLAQGPYNLGPGDKVRINVSEWSTAGGEAKTLVAGEFGINPSGSISLPLVGTIQAVGSTTEHLSQSIAEQMKAKAGLLNPPIASVELIAYRPFYILGGVEKPGEYPYRPGMLVVHAVSVSGGFYRTIDPGLLRASLDLITTHGDVQVHERTLDELTIRHARLQAELNESSTIAHPPDLIENKNKRNISQLMQQEEAILKAHLEAFAAELAARTQLKMTADLEAHSLRDQIEAQDRRVAVLVRDLEDTRSLVSRGLAPAPRQLTAEGAVVDAELRKRDLQTQLLRANQEAIREERAARALRDERKKSLLLEIEQASQRIEETKIRIRTAQAFVGETASAVEAYRPVPRGSEEATFAILRESNGRTLEMPATEITPVLPGDVIRVVSPQKGSNAREGGTSLATKEQIAPASP